MQNTINFIKYHAVEFIKFLGFNVGILILFTLAFIAGGWVYNYLFPIIGNWAYLVTSLLGLLGMYGAIQLYFPGITKQIEP
jgi:hypothetical protein